MPWLTVMAHLAACHHVGRRLCGRMGDTVARRLGARCCARPCAAAFWCVILGVLVPIALLASLSAIVGLVVGFLLFLNTAAAMLAAVVTMPWTYALRPGG